MIPGKALAMAAATALALHPANASAQQQRLACLTEDEVSAIAIYSVPSLVQAARLKCGSELASGGYLARRGDALSGQYAAHQTRVWPRAKTGMLKVLAGQASDAQGRQFLSTASALPDNAVRPLVDAWIVQEASAKIAIGQCRRIEWVMQAMAPIDPEIAGNLLGAIVGLVDRAELPVCQRRS